MNFKPKGSDNAFHFKQGDEAWYVQRIDSDPQKPGTATGCSEIMIPKQDRR